MGRYKPGITEKRLNNRRFRKTEEAILRVFFEENNYISLGRMATKAGVARSTIYHHHKAVKEILPDYQKYLLKSYRRMIRKELRDKSLTIKMMYLKILVFIVQHQKIFLMFVRENNRAIMEELMIEVRGKVMKVTKLSMKSQKAYDIYVDEITGVILRWGKKGFEKEMMDEVLKDLVFLTETLKERLKGVV